MGDRVYGRTPVEDQAAALGEDSERADVLFSHGILDSGSEETGTTSDYGTRRPGLDSIYRVIGVVVAVGCHFRMWTSWCVAVRRGQSGI